MKLSVEDRGSSLVLVDAVSGRAIANCNWIQQNSLGGYQEARAVLSDLAAVANGGNGSASFRLLGVTLRPMKGNQ